MSNTHIIAPVGRIVAIPTVARKESLCGALQDTLRMLASKGAIGVAIITPGPLKMGTLGLWMVLLMGC